MSESTGAMEQFNINELAGATGLILGAVSGILVVIFKSRCFCKFRVGISDKYSLCMCERKPPPDSPRDIGGDSSDAEDPKDPKTEGSKKDPKTEGSKEDPKDPKDPKVPKPPKKKIKDEDILPYPDENP